MRYDLRLSNITTGEIVEQINCFAKSATKAKENFIRRMRYQERISKGDRYNVEVYLHGGLPSIFEEVEA